MQRKGGTGGAGHDVETVLDELYTTPPSDFVARREELAAEARAADLVDEARRIHAARRPTLAAWAANLLLRAQPEERKSFLELGRALREAYRTLDSDGIKGLSEQRRSIVSVLTLQAARLAGEAGHRLSDTAQQDVAATLRAVLADQDAADQWATGRLESALDPPSAFPSGTAPAAGPARKPPRPAAAPPSSRPRAKDELAESRRRRQVELTQAKKTAKAAARSLGKQRAAQAEADTVLQQARDQHEQARRQVAAAEQQLQQACEELQRTADQEQEAKDRRQAAADALDAAEQEAREAEQEVERLAAPVE